MSPVPRQIGVLGCAGVAHYALLDVIAQVPQLRVTAIASRSLERAQAFAQTYQLPRSYGSYQALLEDPAIDLIYNPLPNSLHCEWNLKALRAGKAVVCEKPGAANAAEARTLVSVAAASGLPLIEAYHYRYHPLAQRIADIVQGGSLGKLRHIAIKFHVPGRWLKPDNIRFDHALGGGAMLDPGCYCIDLLRFLMGAEPIVRAAQARRLNQVLDLAMRAELIFSDGCKALVETSLNHPGERLDAMLNILGSEASLQVANPFLPHAGHSITFRNGRDVQIERLSATPSYLYQWQEIARVLTEGLPVRTPLAAGIGTLDAIDAIYRSAGLPLRGKPPLGLC